MTIDPEADFQRRLKTTAALKGLTMRQYCIEAIGERLSKEARGSATPGELTKESAERMAVLQDQIFRSGPLSGDSTDLIRETRSRRAARI